jgi:hypothetical protein
MVELRAKNSGEHDSTAVRIWYIMVQLRAGSGTEWFVSGINTEAVVFFHDQENPFCIKLKNYGIVSPIACMEF